MNRNPIYSPEHSVLVEAIRRARSVAGVSQRELARRLGRSQSHVFMIERGQRRVDIHELMSIARALGLEPVCFFVEVVTQLNFAHAEAC